MRSSLLRVGIVATVLALVIGALGGAAYGLTRAEDSAEVGANLSLSDALNPGGAGFEKVTGPRELNFPGDHGPHPDYALEWWYYTGNVSTPDGRQFGYELTFFRIGLTSEEFDRTSEWATEQMYAAHFALTDVQSDEFHSFERYSRDAIGLAGAVATPFRVWLEDWSAETNGDSLLPLRLQANAEGIGIDMRLSGEKGIVLHGDEGFSRKGDSPGQASHYYSLTRMSTEGTISVNGKSFPVQGLSWMDREWSSSQLSDAHVGWDWFALQLSDGRDIMYGVLRPRSDSGSPFRLGTIVEADGSYRNLENVDVNLEVLDRWQSPLGGTYPSRWRVKIPEEGLDLEVTPFVSDQELDAIVRYWEGAVQIEGSANGKPVSGSGYVELTGYAD